MKISSPYTQNQLLEIYKNETRSILVHILQMYKELSLPQMVEILNMKKTTIQYHLQILRDKGIIIESRESQKESRGSIPTKYFKLKHLEADYHVSFNETKNITDLTKRIEAYSAFLNNLNACIKETMAIMSFAEEGIKSSLRRIEECKKSKLSKKSLDDLHEYIQNTNTSISIFSACEDVNLQICKYLPEVFRHIEQINNQYLESERKKLQKQNLGTDEINLVLQTDDKYLEGYQFITLLHPLKNLITARLEGKRYNKLDLD
ncbi:MAG: winged helix-turn-helix domain-containing protein [Promethearchaeota archaeon]